VSRGRADDTEEFICNRMKLYRDETEPLGITATI
jgi:adenylate kinase family enzyme